MSKTLLKAWIYNALDHYYLEGGTGDYGYG